MSPYHLGMKMHYTRGKLGSCKAAILQDFSWGSLLLGVIKITFTLSDQCEGQPSNQEQHCVVLSQTLFYNPRIVHMSLAFLIYLFICLLSFFSTTPMAYGGSQVRGLIGAIPASLTTATATRDPSRICNLHHSSWQRQMLTH